MMLKFRKLSIRATIATVAVGALLTAGVAYAAWTATGSGSGAAKAGAATDVVVTPGTPTAFLYPSGTSDVAVTVTNNNPFPVTVTALNLDASFGTSGYTASDPLCNTSSLTYTNQSANQVIAGNGGSFSFELADAIAMDNSANDNCQNDAFQIGITAVAASS